MSYINNEGPVCGGFPSCRRIYVSGHYSDDDEVLASCAEEAEAKARAWAGERSIVKPGKSKQPLGLYTNLYIQWDGCLSYFRSRLRERVFNHQPEEPGQTRGEPGERDKVWQENCSNALLGAGGEKAGTGPR